MRSGAQQREDRDAAVKHLRDAGTQLAAAVACLRRAGTHPATVRGLERVADRAARLRHAIEDGTS